MTERKKPDYSKTMIYKINCKNPAIKETYGGHTVDFTNRKKCHKSNCNNPNSIGYNTYVYEFIRGNGNWDNWEMIEIYKFPCNNHQEAIKEEQNFIDKNKCELNTFKAFITEEQKKENLKQNTKDYYEKNKAKMIEYKKKWHEDNKKRTHERRKETWQEYYEKNKTTISEKKKETIICECGSKIRKSHISRHKLSKKHINLMIKLNN